MVAKNKTDLKNQSTATYVSGSSSTIAADCRTFNEDSIDSGINTEETTAQTMSGDIDMQGNSILNTPEITQAGRNIYAGWHLAPIPSVNGIDDTQFDLTAGEGQFVDFSDPENITVTPFSYPGATGIAGTLLGSPAIRQTFITINNLGAVIQRSAAPDGKQGELELFIGNMTHGDDVGTNDIFDDATDTMFSDYSLSRTYRQFLRIFGGINISGIEYAGVSGTLSIQHTSGTGLTLGRNYTVDPGFPDTPDAPAQNPVPAIVQKYEDLSGDLLTASPVNAFVDPNQYRDTSTGTLIAIPNNNWQIKRIFFFYNSNTTIMYYGNAAYANLAAAQNGIITELFNEHADTKEAVFRGYLLVQEGATNLALSAQAEFRTSGGFRPTGSAQGLSTVISLQDAYDNGEDITTNPTNGPLTLIQGSGADTDPLIRFFNGVSALTARIDGDGGAEFNDVTAEEVNAQDTSNDTFQSLQVKNTVGTVNIHGKGNGDWTAINYFGNMSNATGTLQTVEDNGGAVTFRQVLNFINATSIVDNPGNGSTDITFPSGSSAITQFFSQRRNSTQSLSIATDNVIVPNIANTTARGTVLNTATGVTTITSTTEGVYDFNFRADLSINNTTPDAIFLVKIRVNGTTRTSQNFIQPLMVGVFPISISGKFDLVDTDTVDITVGNGSNQIASVQNTGFLYNVTRLSP